MSAEKKHRKLPGNLKPWQLALIVGGGGLAYYLYRKHKSEAEAKAGVTPEEEEKLLGALGRAGGGGGGGETAVSAPVGPIGPAGAVGIAGPPGETQNLTGIEGRLKTIEEHQAAGNKPPVGNHATASQALPKGEARNSKGEIFRTVTKGNNIFHYYPSRKGPTAYVKVGEVHKPTKPRPTKRKAPIHKRVTAKKA
jgi:hypothetical protein